MERGTGIEGTRLGVAQVTGLRGASYTVNGSCATVTFDALIGRWSCARPAATQLTEGSTRP